MGLHCELFLQNYVRKGSNVLASVTALVDTTKFSFYREIFSKNKIGTMPFQMTFHNVFNSNVSRGPKN